MNGLSETSSEAASFGLFNGPSRIEDVREQVARASSLSSSSAALPSAEEVVSMIASDMSRLSLQEREKAENDVHGIGDRVIETPELVEKCLSELDFHLASRKKGTAYELAEAMNRSYTTNKDFRIMFIRAERFNSIEACERMIQFFDLKKALFGHEKLVKDITLSDMNEDDMEALKSGGVQLSPKKDSAGRPIVITLTKLRKYKTAKNMQRAYYYVNMAAIESMENPQLGIVTVGYLRRSLPVHIACQHFAYDEKFAYGNAAIAIYMMSKSHRVRFRSHQGSHLECQYALSTFGIPRNALPVDTTGNTSVLYHLAWLDMRKDEEQSHIATVTPPPVVKSTQKHLTNQAQCIPMSDSAIAAPTVSTTTVEPRPSDILFGRGKTVVEHPGNAWFRDLVDKTMLQYESCTRMEKASLAEMIVDMVKKVGGRFLKPQDEGDGWEEVDDHTARKKVAHTFRNRRKFHNLRTVNPGSIFSMTMKASDEFL